MNTNKENLVMLKKILRRRMRTADSHPIANGHGLDSARLSIGPDGVQETRVYRTGSTTEAPGERLSGRLLGAAGVLIFGALVGAGFVGYEAQRLFALLHNHTSANPTAADQVRAVIIAALPDVGWVAMALVALVAALRGQSSLRARVGVMVFFGLSLGAQILYAPHTIEGMLVAVIAPVTMAWMLESYIVEVRRRVAAQRGADTDETPILTGVLVSAWRVLRAMVRLLLWFLRLMLDPKGTCRGVRTWVLETAPLAPGRTTASLASDRALEQAAEAETTVEQVRAETAAQLQAQADAIAAERAEMAERLNQSTVLARRAERRNIEQELASLNDRLTATFQAWERERAARCRLEELAKATSGRERLIVLYEHLGKDGDHRYGKRAAIGELAGELAAAAGLQSEGTARAYLYEHFDTVEARNSHEMSAPYDMIDAGSGS
ncbi:DUF2637 domain-containing protein [Nonomuraea sp. NPDC050547]|uniref:DUF2637 domain-containing protein n=1 Tax=Nonomuraea sp. NPDC050547 TaxID=3364368 RepID=UPI0037BB17A4